MKKMRSWGNTNEKGLNTSESYVKRNEEKYTEILHFSNSVGIENSHPLERFAKTQSK